MDPRTTTVKHVRRIGIAAAIALAVAGAFIASRRQETIYTIAPQADPPPVASVEAVGPLTAQFAGPSAGPRGVRTPAVSPSEPTPTAEDPEEPDDPATTNSAGRRTDGTDVAADGPQTADGTGRDESRKDRKAKRRGASLSRAEKKLLDVLNEEREEAGCAPLRADRALSRAAQRHSTDMAKRGFFSTQAPDGRGPAERARAEGYRGATAENIAKDAKDARNAVSSWLKSGNAKANLLACGTKSVGIGLAKAESGVSYWTVDFGAP